MPDLAALCQDLAAEQAAVDDLLLAPPGADWTTSTPAPGWTIHHQIAHLEFFDGAAIRAAIDPERFLAEDRAASDADADAYHQRGLALGLSLAPSELHARWQERRERFQEVFSRLEPAARIPWYGPTMSATSKVTARLMECWAHGQDIADALDRQRTATNRLRHVAHIGVRARPYSYLMHGLDPGEEEVHVRLTAPDGEVWTWGDPTAVNRVTGPALDFCLAVTRRRHLDDLLLEVTGPDATTWMAIAQSYAGDPGDGRKPGQFPRH